MSFCNQCGNQLSDADSFCAKCGAPAKTVVDGDAPSSAAEPARVPVAETEQQYEGIATRFLAQVFDLIPIFIFFFIAGNMIAPSVGGQTEGGFELHGAAALALMLLTVIFSIIYFTLLEAWWGGQSLGKKILRIRVVNEDGTAIDLSTSFLRNALRLVDGFMVYLVGAIFISRSPKNQRLGDRLAGTVVVSKPKVPKSGKKKSRLVFGEKNTSMIDPFD